MHKTYLNDREIKMIKGADEIIKKIGGFPSMENGKVISFSSDSSDLKGNCNLEFVFDLSRWKDCLDFYRHPERPWYDHRDFKEQYLKLSFYHCESYYGDPSSARELYFGHADPDRGLNKKRAFAPSVPLLIEGPYNCLYSGQGEFTVFFCEEECEITAELY